MDSALPLRAFGYGLAVLVTMLVLSRSRSVARRQNILLLLSYLLYVSWGLGFLLILLTSTVANFLLGRWIRRKPTAEVLWTALGFNIALLSLFKYLPTWMAGSSVSSWEKFSQIALPLGISFWTFQAMSYLLDLYRGEEADPTIREFALYMAFFPVVISGPICRLPDMLPQFRSQALPLAEDRWRGLCRIATGVLMMQISDLLGKGIQSGQGITAAFDQATAWSGLDVWCMAIGFGLRIFFDFAGYSHIAIGAARMMGFQVPENFARPFTSTSPSVFWTRWHMSLSFWIRDYVFLPLAVLRREDWWRKFCLLLAMVLFGVWHKATLLFVFFGCYHGLLLVGHRQIQQLQRRFQWEPEGRYYDALSWVATMTLVNLGWIFFRANSVTQAGQMLSALLKPATYLSHTLPGTLYLLVAGVAISYAVTLYACDIVDRHTDEAFSASASPSQALRLILLDRWVWLAPLWLLAVALVVSLVPHQGHGANVFLYRSF
jgi:alginate O-acetyltransferase complex protein AlgI